MHWDSVWLDIRHTVRSWRSRPGLYAVALAALALGIGANSTIFSVVETVLLRPLPYRHPEQLVSLYGVSLKKGIAQYFVSPSDFYDAQDRSHTLEAFAAYWRHEVTITEPGRGPEQMPAVASTASVCRALQLQPAAGRLLTEEDMLPSSPNVALITYELWQHRYGGDASAIGRSIGIDGTSTPIVGVLPPGVRFAGDAQIWNLLSPTRTRPSPRFMEAFARLRPGASIEQARAELNSISRSLAVEFPNSNADWSIGVRSLHDELVGSSRPTLVLLLVSVSLLLLIACANVANLLLAHASSRSQEVALRAALGAGAGRLARQFLTESLLLASVGGCAGVLVALAGIRGVRSLGPASVPYIREVSLDLPILLYMLGISVATGLLFGMAPVLRLRRPDLASSVKGGGRAVTAGPNDRRGRGVLVVAQVALAVMLVNGAGLLIRSFARLTAVDPGFHTEHVLTAAISLPQGRYRKYDDVIKAYEQLLSSVRAIPGVQAAGHTTSLPLAKDFDYRVPFYFQALPRPEHLEDQTAWHRMVSPGLFSAMRTPFIAGRDFSPRDTRDAPAVAIINQTLARQFWPSGSPIGQRISAASGGFGPLGSILLKNPEIVGVVADVNYASLGKSAEPAIYFPSLQAPFYSVTLVVRTDATLAPEALIGSVRRSLQQVDPDLPLAHVRTMTEQVSESLSQTRFQTMVLAGLSGLALLLGSIGIYGVLSYGVAVRTREIGIRAALGGRPGDIQRLVLRHGLGLVAAGLVLGMAGSLAAGRLVQTLLFQVTSSDPITYGAVAALLAGVGILAGYLPARSASRIDPVIALRE
ncbi:MAG TPA: ABC transporter permease [Bryobacteraceae bacterium]|nr:ABC transporter permease [Bryobacteraceae bacterium]